jgi:hypothetical protein
VARCVAGRLRGRWPTLGGRRDVPLPLPGPITPHHRCARREPHLSYQARDRPLVRDHATTIERAEWVGLQRLEHPRSLDASLPKDYVWEKSELRKLSRGGSMPPYRHARPDDVRVSRAREQRARPFHEGRARPWLARRAHPERTDHSNRLNRTEYQCDSRYLLALEVRRPNRCCLRRITIRVRPTREVDLISHRARAIPRGERVISPHWPAPIRRCVPVLPVSYQVRPRRANLVHGI